MFGRKWVQPFIISSFILFLHNDIATAIECEGALSNFAMTECEKREFDTANKTLSELLQELKKHLYATERKALDRGQAAWLTYRNAHCDSIVATYGTGSGGPLAGFKCEADLTKDRVKQLRKDFSDSLRAPTITPQPDLPGTTR